MPSSNAGFEIIVYYNIFYVSPALECSVAPGNVQASAVNSTAIRVTWDPPMHMSCDPSTLHYQVQYKAGENGWPMSTEITIDTVITVTGLLPNTSYIFQVRVLGQDLKVLRSSEEISKATPEGGKIVIIKI